VTIGFKRCFSQARIDLGRASWRETCLACGGKATNMGYLLTTMRKAFFWKYARNTWQWDILCVLILIFIFLAPKGWFQSSGRHRVLAPHSPASTLLVGPELIENAGD